MKISTGNFANVKKYRDANLEPINIALSARYFTGEKYKPLNPDWSFKDLPENEYTPIYEQKLNKLNVQKVYNDLLSLSKNKDIVLCCHEKEGDFCHRRLVAKWLEKELNIEVLELGKMELQKTKLELF